MTVIKKHIFIILLLSFNLTISCQSKLDNQKEIYEVLSYLINNYTGKNTDMPPPPPPLPEDKFIITKASLEKGIQGRWKSKKDSIFFYKEYEKIRNAYEEEIKNKKYIIAIAPFLNSIEEGITLESIFKNDYEYLFNKLKNLKQYYSMRKKMIKFIGILLLVRV